jgi:hypothetical protein
MLLKLLALAASIFAISFVATIFSVPLWAVLIASGATIIGTTALNELFLSLSGGR